MRKAFGGLVLSALLAVGGCSAKDTPDGVPTDRPTVDVTAQPQDPELARVTVEQVFDLLAGGDPAGAWELWTSAAKSSVAKDAYVTLIADCPGMVRGDYEITEVRPTNASTATVVWRRPMPDGSAASGSNIVRYEEGSWRFEPDAAALTAYKSGRCT